AALRVDHQGARRDMAGRTGLPHPVRMGGEMLQIVLTQLRLALEPLEDEDRVVVQAHSAPSPLFSSSPSSFFRRSGLSAASPSILSSSEKSICSRCTNPSGSSRSVAVGSMSGCAH